jgi:hypothetical protein
VVILALPATFCGIVTMLFMTGTTLNVPSLMGAMSLVVHAASQWRRHDTHRREQFRRHRVIAVGSFRAALLQIVARRGDARSRKRGRSET